MQIKLITNQLQKFYKFNLKLQGVAGSLHVRTNFPTSNAYSTNLKTTDSFLTL